MIPAKPTRWVYRLKIGEEPFGEIMGSVMRTYHPKGSPPLNRNEWNGMPARSCSIQRVSLGAATEGKLQIEIEYRPKDWVSFVGDTKYVGWTAYMLNRSPEGVLLDSDGNPLADGEQPVLLPYDVYDDIDFNNLEFGMLIEEIPCDQDEDVAFDDIVRRIERSGHFKMGAATPVSVLHRYRPSVMILISDNPTGQIRGGFGELIQNINSETPHLKQAVAEVVLTLVRGYLEGRYDMSVLQGADVFMLDLSKLLVDARGKESRFECLLEFLPQGFLNELARRIASRYMLQARVVTGNSFGLLLEFEEHK